MTVDTARRSLLATLKLPDLRAVANESGGTVCE
jgi:hypothetical protein